MSEASEKKRKIPVWVWIVGGILVLSVIGNLIGDGSESEPAPTESETSEPLSGGTASSGSSDPEPVEPDPEPVEPDSEPTTGEKLAAVDDNYGQREEYERRFQQVLERCDSNTEQELGDALYVATEALDDRGVSENSLWAMESLLNALPVSGADGLDCREVLALLVIERAEQGP